MSVSLRGGRTILSAILLGTTLVAAGCTTAPTNKVENEPYVSGLKNVTETPAGIGVKVANWQLQAIDDGLVYIDELRHKVSSDPTQWVQASFFVGLNRFAETVGDQELLDAVDKMSKKQDFELNERSWHGDDQLIAELYAATATRQGDLSKLEHVLSVFDGILADPPTTSLKFDEPSKDGAKVEGTCQKRWCWADAIFMAPPAWMAVSDATGDPRYLDYAVKETFDVIDYLHDSDTKLFFRDSRYFTKKTENGGKVFWSRGNGWVFAGLARMIERLDSEDPRRAKLEDTFVQLADSLVERQRESGYWPTSLDDDGLFKNPETSGTGFFGFGLAWGVNNGILVGEKYENSMNRAWAAMNAAVFENGKVGWVQQIGKDPQKSEASDSQLYAAGAMLLFSSEMHKRRIK